MTFHLKNKLEKKSEIKYLINIYCMYKLHYMYLLVYHVTILSH